MGHCACKSTTGLITVPSPAPPLRQSRVISIGLIAWQCDVDLCQEYYYNLGFACCRLAAKRCLGKSAARHDARRSLASFIAQYAHKSATFRARRHDLLAPRSADICRHLTHPLYPLSLLAGPLRTYNSMTTADRTRPNLCLAHTGFHQTAVRAVKVLSTVRWCVVEHTLT